MPGVSPALCVGGSDILQCGITSNWRILGASCWRKCEFSASNWYIPMLCIEESENFQCGAASFWYRTGDVRQWRAGLKCGTNCIEVGMF